MGERHFWRADVNGVALFGHGLFHLGCGKRRNDGALDVFDLIGTQTGKIKRTGLSDCANAAWEKPNADSSASVWRRVNVF